MPIPTPIIMLLSVLGVAVSALLDVVPGVADGLACTSAARSVIAARSSSLDCVIADQREAECQRGTIRVTSHPVSLQG